MATGTPTTSPSPLGKGSATLVDYDVYIDRQIGKTRRHVWSVDLASSLLLLVAGTMAFFLAAAVLDHWVVPGGLGFWSRAALCLSYLGGAGWFVYRELAPLVLRKINPVYAAQTIERSEPKLKNTLINFLLFRGHQAELPPPVFEALEEQAATNLSRTPVDLAVDRSKLVRIGYVLLGVLVLATVYKLFSPKDPLQTVSRVLVPWADIQAPTRVVVRNVRPGNVELFRGKPLEVSAEVRGLKEDQPVLLVYSTADGQAVDRSVEMRRQPRDDRFAATLPESDGGLQQDLSYRVVAGDGASPRYEVRVAAAPSIVVRSVDYEFPAYTGFEPQTVGHQGDLKAIEGTVATIHAQANQPIRQAWIDFDGDEQPDLRMSARGDEATARIPLELAEDRRGPLHSSYQVLMQTAAGHKNADPQRYRIEVTADLPPEVQFLAPKRDEVQLPVGGRLTWELAAHDPDFALKRVTLRARLGERELVKRELVSQAWRGQLTRRVPLDAKKLDLKAGDVVEYWAEAEDVKSPQPNRVQTARRRIQIVEPKPGEEPLQGADADQADQDQRPGDEPADDEQGPKPNRPDAKADGGENTGDKSQAAPGDKPDRDQHPRDDQSPAKPGQQEKAANGDAAGGGTQQQGGKPEGDKQPGQPQPGGKGQAGDKGQPGKAAQADDGSDSGDASAGDARSPEGDKTTGEKSGGENRSSQKPSGKPQPGGQAGGEPSDHPVPSDGTDDGEAIQRILQHRREQGGKEPADRASKTPEPQGAAGSAGEKPGDARQQQPSPGDKPSTAAQGAGDKAAAQAGDEKSKAPGQGKQRPDAKGGEPEQSRGDSGAGEQGKNDHGSPAAQGENTPRSKHDRPAAGKSDQGDEAQSPSKSKRQSDSQGGEAGDNSGGGKEGGGQNANRAGTGGQGQNTAADEGSGRAEQAGQGEDSQRAGQGRQVDEQTGRPGSQPGEASPTNDAGTKPGPGKADQGAAGKDHAPADPQRDTPGEAGQPGQGPQGRPGGNPAQGDPNGAPTTKTKASEANLEYARRATDLAIDHLKDQLAKDEVDPKLLDQLGWSKPDLEQFIRRWEERRAAADGSDDSRRALDEALRSLGLRPRSTTLKASASRDDQQRGLKESRRTAPPAEYQEQYRAYTEGTARGGEKSKP